MARLGDDGQVLLMQLGRHVLAHGLAHRVEGNLVAKQRERAEEHRVGDSTTQQLRRDAVGIKGQQPIASGRSINGGS